MYHIKIREIPPQGLEIEEQLKPDVLGLTDKEFASLTPVKVAGKVEKVGTTVLANVSLESEIALECGRCLEPMQRNIRHTCDFDYEIDKRTEFIDIGEDIRQEIVMALSPSAVCAKDCKGLCPGCGVNLNKESCKCHKSQDTRHKT